MLAYIASAASKHLADSQKFLSVATYALHTVEPIFEINDAVDGGKFCNSCQLGNRDELEDDDDELEEEEEEEDDDDDDDDELEDDGDGFGNSDKLDCGKSGDSDKLGNREGLDSGDEPDNNGDRVRSDGDDKLGDKLNDDDSVRSGGSELEIDDELESGGGNVKLCSMGKFDDGDELDGDGIRFDDGEPEEGDSSRLDDSELEDELDGEFILRISNCLSLSALAITRVDIARDSIASAAKKTWKNGNTPLIIDMFLASLSVSM
jgi:hypothetical protein